MRLCSTPGASRASSAARVRDSSPDGSEAARARISARSGPSSKRRSATSNLPAWTENFTSRKLVVIALSFGA
jgi:hypothetical protein